MQAFTQYTPTEIVFGKDAQKNTAELIQKYRGTKVMVVYGGGSVVRSGLLPQITQQLEQAGFPYLLYGGVQPNPLLTHAKEGIRQASSFGADFILAVGGGSAIDEAKAIAHGTKNPNTPIWDFWKRQAELTASLPIGVVLTISAAGSETSNSAVITNEETGEKRGLSTDFNRPCFAIMNPELTYTLPKEQLTYGIVDIMMHTLERYFTKTDGNELTDEIASSLLRVMIHNGPIAIENQTDYNAMSEIMWCGSLSHNGLTGLGRPMDFSVHQLGHELGGRFNVTHGASLSTMWGYWAQYCYKEDPKRFAFYAKKVWGVDEDDTNRAAQAGIQKTVEFFRLLGASTCFTELGIGILEDRVIDELAESCVFQGTRLVGNFRPLNKSDIIEIYRMANH